MSDTRETESKQQRKRGKYFVEQRDVKGKSELIFQTDFVGQLIAEFPRRSGRIGQQRLGVTVHKRDGQHDGFFRFCGLRKHTISIECYHINFSTAVISRAPVTPASSEVDFEYHY